MTKEEIEKSRNYPVMKSNEMIQKTSFMLDKQEYNLLQFIISKIKPDDTEIKPIYLSINEYCAVCGINNSGKNYEDVKNSLKNLADKSVWFDDGKYEQVVRWIEDPKIEKSDGVIEVQLKKIWHEHLLQLHNYYTRINMTDIIPMKSIYGKRMYELLMSFQMNNKGSYVILFELDDLREKLLGKEDSKKKHIEYKNFKANVLKKALKDMKEYGILEVTMNEKKLGKFVRSLEFIINIKSLEDRLLAGQQSMNFFEV